MSLSGVLIVDKPIGVTSHDVILRLRRTLGVKRIGHTGTLDPAASGVLLACVGKATKVVQFLSEYDKEYEAVIKLGVTTDTYDGAGKITESKDEIQTDPDQIAKAVLSFKGRIRQTPPPYSAVKYRGKKLYQYARAQVKVEVREREVEIKEIQIEEINPPYVKLRVSCSKGTYLRTLAFDIGEKLGCGAHLHSLHRSRVGPFGLEDASDLEEIEAVCREGEISKLLVPLERTLSHLCSVVVKEDFCERVQQGVPLLPDSVATTQGDFGPNQQISIKDGRGNILAIGKALGSSSDFLDAGHRKKLFEYTRVI